MKIRKKVLSVFCAAMLLGTITSVTVPQVQASDEQTKKVDGSYLTMQESASGTTQSEDVTAIFRELPLHPPIKCTFFTLLSSISNSMF